MQVSVEHIVLDENGIARLAGTRIKVQHLIEARKAGVDTPEKLHEAYPHLSFAQIHAALAYYYDHQSAIDEQIAASQRLAEELRPQAANAELVKKLIQRGAMS